MIEAIIFDIDGTLIDSNDFHAEAWEKAFAAHGFKIPRQKIRPHLGKGGDQLMPEFLNKKEIESQGKAITQSREEIFQRDYMGQVRPFPQVRELFKKLRESNIRIALASSSKEKEVEEYKTIAQIADLVEKSTSSDYAQKSKPHPDIFLAALDQLGQPNRQKVRVVGDTPYDAIAAVKAKLPIIGLLCGGFPEKALRAAGCQSIFQDPADLLANVHRILKTG